MHVKFKYINAVHAAIDFIENRVDGADEGQQEEDTLDALRELISKMKKSQHTRMLKYYINKNLKNKPNQP